MKKYLVLLILPLILLASSNTAQAQYKNALGLRLGPAWGVTFKHKFSEKNALELLLNSYWGSFVVTGLYEYHIPVITDGMNFYVGGGAHLGFYNYNSRWDRYWGTYRGGAFLGFDGILGLEYTFSEVPINLSIDWKPAFDFFGYHGFWGDGGAFSIRYAF